MKTIAYETQSPLPHISFNHPATWQLIQSTGKGYKEITLLGPRNDENTLNIALIFRFTNLSTPIFEAKEAVETYLSRRQKLRGFSLLNQSQILIDCVEATSIEINYFSPKSLEVPGLGNMRIVEKRIIFIRENILFEIIFTGTEDDYLKYSTDFREVLQSLKFL